MKVVVLLDVAADVRIPPERDPRSGRVRMEWLVPEVDPASARALDLALALTSDRPNGHLTVIHLGPPAHDSYLRQALARGCDQAVRVWDGEAAEARTAGKALILAAAAQTAGYDLVLAGSRGVIDAGGQLGVLFAAHLGVPCVTEVGTAALSPDSRRLEATRELERGFREKVEAGLPAVITVSAAASAVGDGGLSTEASARALLKALEQEITTWTLADLGVVPGAAQRADRALEYGAPRPRHPRLHPVVPPDPTLPAFDRILSLVRGSVKHREGRVVRLPVEEVAQEVFEVLRDEGWLDHLRPGGALAVPPGADAGSTPEGGRLPVIPLEYRLREPVRLEPWNAGTWRVVCEEPLTVLTINTAAARLLKRTRHGATITDIAAGLGLSEEGILQLCEYFRGRGLLDVRRAAVDAGPAPLVTVIVPTLDRADDLDQCLTAIAALDYPADQLEVIVVDDGSTDPGSVARVAEVHRARLLANDRNRGPSFSRNRAAQAAKGEILAFIDSDCVPGRSWLGDLTPFFAWDRVGAVGGRTVGYYTESRLDRYEEVASPLDMGRHLMVKAQGADTLYVPTCNLLVRRSTYEAVGGLREDLRVGEDVDLCWRIRAAGQYLFYAPEGIVRHKHRDSLSAMLRRRAQYGTSEAMLHGLHPDKRKRFPLAPAPLATVAFVSAALVRLEPRLLPLCLAPSVWDGARRRSRLRRSGVALPESAIWTSVLRGHLSMLYFVYFHLTRYYLGPLTVGGVAAPGVWALEAAAVLYSAGVDYSTRRPRMSFPVYLAYYVAEHAAYQTGVAAGCVRAGSFRSYLPAFLR